jgi:hypothetical protein
MGPFQLLRQGAYNLEWAHSSYKKKLPMVLHGPIMAAEI